LYAIPKLLIVSRIWKILSLPRNYDNIIDNVFMECSTNNNCLNMRRRIEIMAKSTSAKNGHERITTNRDNMRHLEYFNNGQWRHSDKCRKFTNKECSLTRLKSA
jgi:hypothetical protein